MAEPEIETIMHNKIMRLTELITVTLLIANKELYKIMQPDFRSLVHATVSCKIKTYKYRIKSILTIVYYVKWELQYFD